MSAPELEVQRGRALVGFTGPRAPAWLASLGVAVPDSPNTWVAGPNASTIMRLGAKEFLVDADAADPGPAELHALLRAEPPGVYPVPREDWELRLRGARTGGLLAEVCAVDFAALDAHARPVIMTLIAGIAVIVALQEIAGGRVYRIWCDPTYGPALSAILDTLVHAHGGGREP